MQNARKTEIFKMIENNSVTVKDEVRNDNFTHRRGVDNMMVEDNYIFDRTDVRVIFITIYSLVFCICVFGNLLVIIVVTWSRQRSTTNIFFAHLAVANLCVGIFCVLQNLSIYLIPSWVFGDFLCKMYQYINSLSYTASIFILVLISTERYFAILRPIYFKFILTRRKLRIIISFAWCLSVLYALPRFIIATTIRNPLPDGTQEILCILPRDSPYNSEFFDVINFLVLYVAPLTVMTFHYVLISLRLWSTSSFKFEHTRLNKKRKSRNPEVSFGSNSSSERDSIIQATTDSNAPAVTISRSGDSIRIRRRVIRMLIAIVLTFAFCNLPLHARKIWQLISSQYEDSSIFGSLFTPLTFLLTYCNSAINPLLYTFLSKRFQDGMKELRASLGSCVR